MITATSTARQSVGQVTRWDAAAARQAETRFMEVDPHALVRWALVKNTALEPDLVTVAEAVNVEEATNLAFALRPDVVTVDSSLGSNEVWSLVRALRAADENVGIVVITDDASDETLFHALDCASALVLKSAPIAEVVSAIRHAAMSPNSFSASGLGPALRRRRERTDRPLLSPRELQIVLLLHDGLSVPQIASELFLSLSTAKTYVSRVYEKLGARNRAQALMTAMRMGLFEMSATRREFETVSGRRSA